MPGACAVGGGGVHKHQGVARVAEAAEGSVEFGWKGQGAAAKFDQGACVGVGKIQVVEPAGALEAAVVFGAARVVGFPHVPAAREQGARFGAISPEPVPSGFAALAGLLDAGPDEVAAAALFVGQLRQRHADLLGAGGGRRGQVASLASHGHAIGCRAGCVEVGRYGAQGVVVAVFQAVKSG